MCQDIYARLGAAHSWATEETETMTQINSCPARQLQGSQMYFPLLGQTTIPCLISIGTQFCSSITDFNNQLLKYRLAESNSTSSFASLKRNHNSCN